MANLRKIIYINEEDYSTLINGDSLVIDGTTYTYEENALYVIKNAGPPEYAETAGYATNAGTSQVAVTDASGNNIVATYEKKPLIIEIERDDASVQPGTYNNIKTAIADKRNVIVKFEDGNEFYYLPLIYDGDLVGDPYMFCSSDEYTFNGISIYDDDTYNYFSGLSAPDDSVVHILGSETISGNKTFTGTVSLGSNATATTPAATDNDTSVATTAFVHNVVNAIPEITTGQIVGRMHRDNVSGTGNLTIAGASGEGFSPNGITTAGKYVVVVYSWSDTKTFGYNISFGSNSYTLSTTDGTISDKRELTVSAGALWSGSVTTAVSAGTTIIVEIYKAEKTTPALSVGTVALTNLYNDLDGKPTISDSTSSTSSTDIASSKAVKLAYDHGGVQSVNGQTGAVSLSIPDDSNLVHKTGNETISGTKSFGGENADLDLNIGGTSANIVLSAGVPANALSGGEFGWISVTGKNNTGKTLQQALDARNNVQADWNQTTATADDYIKNKPDIPVINAVTETYSSTAADTTTPFTASIWRVDLSDKVTELYTGLTILIKVPVAGNGTYGTLLRIDGTTAADDSSSNLYPVCANVNSMVSTRYAVGCIIPLTFDATQAGQTLYYNSASAYTTTASGTGWTKPGCWKIADYSTGDTTTGREGYYYLRPYAGQAVYRYKYLMEGADGRLYPIVTTNQTSGTSVTKTPTTVGLRPWKIWYYNHTDTVSAGAAFGAQRVYPELYTTTATYNFNASTGTYAWIFLQGSYNKDTDLFTLDTGNNYYKFVRYNAAINWASSLTTGKYYILLGSSYSTTNYVQLYNVNPFYYFNGTNLIPVTTKIAQDSGPVTSVNGQTGNVNLTLGDTNVIESISVNGVAQTVTDKNVDITIEVPEGELSENYATSELENENLMLAAGDTFETAFSKVEKAIIDNEETVAGALNDLNERLLDIDVPSSVSDLTDDVGIVKSITLNSNTYTPTNGVVDLGTITGTGTGEANIIESVKVNGTALTVTNKAVDITAVPASIVTADSTHRFVTDSEKTTWNAGQANVIETIKVNSTALTPDANKAVDITSIPASILTGTIPNNITATTQSQNDNSTKVATTAYVDTAIDNIPNPMIFKGSLGTGGTITALPTAATSNEGYTYKVITNGTYGGQSAKIGDTFISDGTQWIYIPSGDEPSGTVTSVGAQGVSGSHISVTNSPITTSGTLSIGIENGYSIPSVANQTTWSSAIRGLTIDSFSNPGVGATSLTPDNNKNVTLYLDDVFSYNNKLQLLNANGDAINYITVAQDAESGVTSNQALITGGYLNQVLPSTSLSNNYAPSTDTNENLILEAGDTYEEAFAKLEKTINDNETITATALTDLDGRIPTKTSDLTNDSGFITSVPVTSVNGQTGAVNLTIPSAVTESTVSGWGFTKNAGTVTGITMNGASKGTSGVVDLGTVLTSFTETDPTVQSWAKKAIGFGSSAYNGELMFANTFMNNWANNGYVISLKNGENSAITNIYTSSNIISNSGERWDRADDYSLITTKAIKDKIDVKYTKPSAGIPASDLASAVQTSLGLADTALQSFTETDPTVPAWAKAANKPTYTASEVGALPDTTVIPAAPGTLNTTATTAQSTSSSEALSGNITLHKVAKTGTYGDLIGAKTKLSEFTNDSSYIANNTFYNTITLRSTTTTLNSEDIILQTGANKIELNPTGLTYRDTKHFLFDDAVITTDIEGGVDAHWSTLSDSQLLSAAVIKTKLDELPTVNNATLTIQKNGTTVNTFTANASSNVTANIQVNELPTVSSSDNGKILQVVNGAWSLVTPVTVYTGTSTPNNSQGNNGDLYVQTS